MSSSNNLPLTKEQEDLLKELEDEFKDRYTENDEEFMAVFNEKPPSPPVVENWFEPNPRNRFRGDNNRQDFNRRHYWNVRHFYEGDRNPHFSRRHQYHNQKPC